MELNISNTNRTCGAMLSGQVCKFTESRGWRKIRFIVNLKAWQARVFAAFLAKGVTLNWKAWLMIMSAKGFRRQSNHLSCRRR